MGDELTNIREEVVRKLNAVETRLTASLYDVDLKLDSLHANLDEFRAQTVKELEKVA